jgi:hypothetical protein
MLIQSFIWCCDNIITHCDDWSLFYNVITTSYQWLIHISITLNLGKHFFIYHYFINSTLTQTFFNGLTFGDHIKDV